MVASIYIISLFFKNNYMIAIATSKSLKLFSTLTQSRNIAAYERQALYDLYNSTNGNNWIYQEGNQGHWDFTDYPNVNPCLASNPWQGLNCTLPKPSSKYFYISEIKLSNYNLSGTIPDTIGSFSYLQYLDFSYNHIVNTIPNTIGNLSELLVLNISYNSLWGSLPNRIYELSKLQKIDFQRNYLKGTLSNLVGHLSQLQHLNLKNNSLTGTIPSTIGDLSETLTYFRLFINQFTGTIPDTIRKLTKLYFFSLGFNHLTGTIPNWIGELSLVEYCFLTTNKLYGTIPNSFYNLTHLKLFDFGDNKFTGTISDSIGTLLNLSIFYLDNNLLSGTIPSSLSKLANNLKIFDLGYNMLSLTIPSSFSSLILLKQIYINNNFLTGSIPNLFVKLLMLKNIKLNDNSLTGTIPDSVSKLSNLSFLFLQNNHLSGHLNQVFNNNYQTNLKNIQLSSNQFTGTLPEQVFLSQKLIVFSAASNCFHGSIPSIICNVSTLKTLILDGLACASSCQKKILPSFSSAYFSENDITGGIPKCLWSMSNLEILHLSGNNLKDKLPGNIDISVSLLDIALSNNLLTGSIPNNIQQRVWDNLDLSNNRLSGELNIKFNEQNYKDSSTNASLSLKNNRLSGNIYNEFQEIKKISILQGNYFNCKYNHNNLPKHDDQKDKYECGSDTFNILYYIWVGSLFVFCSCIALAWYYRAQIDKYFNISAFVQQILKWIDIIQTIEDHYELTKQAKLNKLIDFRFYIFIQDIIVRYSFYCTLVIIMIMLPVYTILSFEYGTHSEVYAWTVSIFYISGKIAFGIIISLLVLFLFLQIVIFSFSIQQIQKPNLRHNSTISLQVPRPSQLISDNKSIEKLFLNWKVYSMYVLFILINFFLAIGANLSYIYVSLYQSNTIRTICQIFLSIFNMILNNIISPIIVYWIVEYLSIRNLNSRLVERRLFVLHFIVSLFNNIIIPCTIVAIISPNCYYDVFKQESEVTSSFSYVDCEKHDLNGDCIEYGIFTSTTSYSPPFTYSYQCSADFVTYYAPVFVLACFISTFIVPVINYIILRLSQQSQSEYYSLLHELPKILKLNYSNVSGTLLPINEIHEFLISTLTMVGLLLTFGVIFPPLAAAFLVAICRRVCYHKAIIGRYVSHIMETKRYFILDIIEEDCKVIPLLSTLQLCGWILLSVSFIFYTLFLFDILGDDVGVNKAYWVLIVMPCIPIFLYIIYQLYNYVSNSHRNNEIKSTIRNISIEGIELASSTMIENPLSIRTSLTNLNDNNLVDDMMNDIDVEDREGNSIYNKEIKFEKEDNN